MQLKALAPLSLDSADRRGLVWDCQIRFNIIVACGMSIYQRFIRKGGVAAADAGDYVVFICCNGAFRGIGAV